MLISIKRILAKWGWYDYCEYCVKWHSVGYECPLKGLKEGRLEL